MTAAAGGVRAPPPRLLHRRRVAAESQVGALEVREGEVSTAVPT
jgi:hypothetical protein